MKWGEVKVGDVFVTKCEEKSFQVDDVWVVLDVSPSKDEIFVSIRYAYLHNIGEPDSILEWYAVAEQHVLASKYDFLSER